MDVIGIVAPQENVIKVLSDDFDIRPIYSDDLDKKEEEIGTSEGLIRGVVAKLKEMGYKVGGFKAFITSDVLMGAGLSSSDTFETIIGTIQAFVENDHVAAYKEGIEKVFGEGSCHVLKVRKYGGYKVLGFYFCFSKWSIIS